MRLQATMHYLLHKEKKRVGGGGFSLLSCFTFTSYIQVLQYPFPRNFVLTILVFCLIGQNWPVALWRDNKISFNHSYYIIYVYINMCI